MKKFSVIALSAMLMTAPAFAETSANYNTNQTVEQEIDLSAVFADNQNLQVATLSEQEMKETEGALIPLPLAALTLGGGAVGAWGNHAVSYAQTGQSASVNDTLNATGMGMMTGASLYGGGRVAGLKVDGPSAGLTYGNGRVFQIRKDSQPVFRIDYHPNPSPTKLHIHTPPNMKDHRPWNKPWTKYD